MTFDLALRLTEISLAVAFLLQSVEHMAGPRDERVMYSARFIAAGCLLAGLFPAIMSALLLLHALWALHRFQGPYNGGSDRMGLLVLFCLTLAHWLPEQAWRELAFGYLAVQLALSYAISGWVKIVNPDWGSGRALQDVFLFSVYPAHEGFRALAQRPGWMVAASWGVIVFELAFPLAFASPIARKSRIRWNAV